MTIRNIKMEAAEGTVEAVLHKDAWLWEVSVPWSSQKFRVIRNLKEVRKAMRHEIAKRDNFQPPKA